MHDYYASRAPEYDRVYLKPERQSDLDAIRRWLPPLFAGKSVPCPEVYRWMAAEGLSLDVSSAGELAANDLTMSNNQVLMSNNAVTQSNNAVTQSEHEIDRSLNYALAQKYGAESAGYGADASRYQYLAAIGQVTTPQQQQAARDDAPGPSAAGASSERGAGQMCTTGQVRVRVMPSRFWTFETTSLPSSSTLRASARTITS